MIISFEMEHRHYGGLSQGDENANHHLKSHKESLFIEREVNCDDSVATICGKNEEKILATLSRQWVEEAGMYMGVGIVCFLGIL